MIYYNKYNNILDNNGSSLFLCNEKENYINKAFLAMFKKRKESYNILTLKQ